MTERLKKIRCWHCGVEYDYSIDIPEDHVFSTYCGICEAENVIDLNPYKKRQEQTFRFSGPSSAPPSVETPGYDFPDEIPGKKPGNE